MLRPALSMLVAAPLLTAVSQADPIEFTVDPALSSIGLQLCVNVFGTQCGADSSPAIGTVLADVDVTPRVAEISILDINVDAENDLSVNINLGGLHGHRAHDERRRANVVHTQRPRVRTFRWRV